MDQSVNRIYPCLTKMENGTSCSSTASYFAIDNRAKLGHICRQCWVKLSLEERKLYGD